MEEQLTYNQAINELEEIVKKMQSPDCDIDNLSKYTSRALQLLKLCKTKLTATNTELQKILAEIEQNNQQ